MVQGIGALNFIKEEYNADPKGWVYYSVKEKNNTLIDLLIKDNEAIVFQKIPTAPYSDAVCKRLKVNDHGDVKPIHQFGYRELNDKIKDPKTKDIQNILKNNDVQKIKKSNSPKYASIGPIHVPFKNEDIVYYIVPSKSKNKEATYYTIFKNLADFDVKFDKDSVKEYSKMQKTLEKQIKDKIGHMFS